MTLVPFSQGNEKKPLTVIHVITGLNMGGAERVLSSLLTSGLEGPVANQVISLMGDGHYGPVLRDAGIKVTCLDMQHGLPTPSVIGRLHSELRVSKPDIIQGWMYHGNIVASLGRYLAPRSPAIAWNIRTSMDDPSLIRTRTRLLVTLGGWLSRRVDSIVYNSHRSKRQHHELGYASSCAEVIPNGFDLNYWRHDEAARRSARAELGILDGKLAIGFIGRAAPDKDIPTLLRAFACLREQHPQAMLICIGRDIEKDCPSDVSTQGVTFLGQRNDLAHLVPGFDLFCLSSRIEGFPNVIGEAMACAVPCVTTDVGDAAEIVGDTGWIASPSDLQSFIDALSTALLTNPDERLARGRAARQMIENRYTLPKIVRQYLDMYNRIGS